MLGALDAQQFVFIDEKTPFNIRRSSNNIFWAQTVSFATVIPPADESPWAESPPPSRTPGPTARGAGREGTPLGHQWRGWQGPGGQRSNMGSACPTERPESVYDEDGLVSRPYTGLEPITPGAVNPMEEVGPTRWCLGKDASVVGVWGVYPAHLS